MRLPGVLGEPAGGFGGWPNPPGHRHAAILTGAVDAGLPLLAASSAAAVSRLMRSLGTMNP
jgi:hypothetical protein